jgi:hypothetical protein
MRSLWSDPGRKRASGDRHQPCMTNVTNTHNNTTVSGRGSYGLASENSPARPAEVDAVFAIARFFSQEVGRMPAW